MDILSIEDTPILDNRITKIEIHGYNPYANTSLGNNDEIRIPIQQQDLYTLPSQSFLYIEGKLVREYETDNTSSILLDNNCMAFLFDEIRYEMDGVEIDQTRNLGIATSLKNFLSLKAGTNTYLENAGWLYKNTTHETKDKELHFNFCVPLRLLLGFCEDYKNIIVNSRHELILIRSREDSNSLYSATANMKGKIELQKVQWKMPHIALEDLNRLSILRFVENGRTISMAFRSWDLYEYPLLQSTTKHTWSVKATSQLEKPRYVILALQTGRKNNINQNAGAFDHCNLSNVRLYLNSESYPYENLNIDFKSNKYAILYHMYSRFRPSYYGTEATDEALLTKQDFKNIGPLVVIDCSRQIESIKTATVDIRIDFECRENIPANTTAYCLILHDRIIEYTPLTNVVRKVT